MKKPYFMLILSMLLGLYANLANAHWENRDDDSPNTDTVFVALHNRLAASTAIQKTDVQKIFRDVADSPICRGNCFQIYPYQGQLVYSVDRIVFAFQEQAKKYNMDASYTREPDGITRNRQLASEANALAKEIATITFLTSAYRGQTVYAHTGRE